MLSRALSGAGWLVALLLGLSALTTVLCLPAEHHDGNVHGPAPAPALTTALTQPAEPAGPDTPELSRPASCGPTEHLPAGSSESRQTPRQSPDLLAVRAPALTSARHPEAPLHITFGEQRPRTGRTTLTSICRWRI
ncbi:hypothetical protein DVA86_18895 [Streptomyces armeniacus]|uniref:Uncharacterized protein n=1 Tax=Streptomyces armeniacus TaxID=83291 RepID=A0A345XRZ1_9ACTN|nr:hypothetical protein DVA86_18895 [Streptomyces armeniacus]